MFKRVALFVAVVLLCVFGGAALAQDGGTLRILDETDIPIRDVLDLAERLSGVAGATHIQVTPAPDFAPGDRHSFFVGHSDFDEIFEVEAVLAAETDGVYMWVEVGVPHDAALLESIARQLDREIFPYIRQHFGSESSPGIDGDPHVYILNAANIGGRIGGYFNDNSVYPRQVFASSNEHEMFVIAVDNIPFNSPSYINVLAHEFVHMTQHNQDINEETWFSEGTAEIGAMLATQNLAQPYGLDLATAYFTDPTIQLNGWDLDNPSGYYGGASLFFTYLVERFGDTAVLTIAREPADGITGIENALATLGAFDSETGEAVNFDALYADWVIANLLNDTRVHDGRYGYSYIGAARKASVTSQYQQYPMSYENRRVNQYGPHYLQLNSAEAQTLSVGFSGSPTVQLVPTEPRSGTHFYWANRSNQSAPRMTQTFDLRGATSATLSFWHWHEMEPFWDYAYISVSADGGQTWQVIETATTTTGDPNNRAFAPGWTGFSGMEAPRPAPFMGISYDPATGAIIDLLPGEGAEVAGMQSGDVLTGINGISFAPSDLVPTLDQFRAGETVVFTVLRGSERFDLPVTLGAHPQRELAPAQTVQWVQEVIDLTPYAGNEVTVRFEYVTDQSWVRNGWVIDDISIAEIGYFDDAETGQGGWTLEGWVRVENELPQEFLVQVIERVDGVSIRRLLLPGEGHSGQWTVEVGPGAPATLIVSGMTPYTRQPALYNLSVTP